MDILSEFVATLIDLVVNALPLAAGLLILTTLGVFVFNWIQARTQWKWVASTALTLFVLVGVLLMAFHTLNILNGVGDTNLNQIPPDIRAQPEFSETQASPIVLFFQALLQTIITSAVLTLILLPVAFIGLALFEILEKKIPGVWARLAVTCFIGALVLILLLAAFPWILVALLYLAVFGI